MENLATVAQRSMMTALREKTCPGCGSRMPAGDMPNHGYYNTSPECWAVYTEVLGCEFGNPVQFGQVHQLSVDTYAVQHAGGGHPDKSMAIHLSGLHLMLDRGIRPTSVPRLLQALAKAVTTWPHFKPPIDMGSLTVSDVALSDSVEGHINAVEKWAGLVWKAWSPHHAEVKNFVEHYLELE